MAKKIRLEFRVLLYPEDGWWIAHCLEMDLPAEGKTPGDAIKNLVSIANVQIATAMDDGNLSSIFSPSPAELWQMFARASDKKLPQRPKVRFDSVDSLSVREMASV